MFVVEIGKPAPFPVIEHDGVRYEYLRDHHMLVLFLSRPKPHEVRAVQTGSVRFALTPLREKEQPPSLLFLLFTFPGSIPWADAPFHMQLEPEELRPTLDTLTDETIRLTPSIILVDLATTIVQALRVVSFSPRFSRALNETMRRQLDEPFDRHAYDQALARAYQQYPKPQDLLSKRVAHCEGGE